MPVIIDGTTGVSGVNGSASTPAVQGTDTNTGMFFPAADTIAFAEGGTEVMRIGSTGYVTNAVNGLGNGLIQAQQYYRLDSNLVGANVNTAQNVFGVGVTLVGSTVYEFEMVVAMAKTAGTTSHTIGIGFGGTATVNNAGIYILLSSTNTLTGNTEISSTGVNYVSSLANSTQTSASTAASRAATFMVKGTISVNAGGTFIPQYTLSAAPGGAYTTQAGSYIKISPLSASGSNTSIGSWA